MSTRLPFRAFIAVCGLVLLMVAPAADAQSPPDTIGTTDEWLLHPEQPCVDEDVVLYVRGFHSTPCDSFIFGGRVGDREVLLRSLIYEGRACAVAPIPYAIPIHFGTTPAGPQSIHLRHQYLVLHSDGTLDSTTYQINVGFTVISTCPILVPAPAVQLPFVADVNTVPRQPCPERPTSIEMLFEFPDACGRVLSAGNDNGNLSVVVSPYHPPGTECPMFPPEPPVASLPLGFLATGSYHVNIDLTVQGMNAVWPPIFDQHGVGAFDFFVRSPCETTSQPLPFVDFIRIVGPDSLSSPCAGLPFSVLIGGTFPDDCISLNRVELLDMWMGPGSPQPRPPIVRVIVDDRNCLLPPCREGPFPWSTSVSLPPLPMGQYGLVVQLVRQIVCADSTRPDSMASTSVPFVVQPAESCGVSVFHCLRGAWLGDELKGCDAIIGSNSTAELTFQLHSNTALSGLQGTFRFTERGLGIKEIATAGPAVGMHLSWTKASDGARFVVFAEHGAPIPPSLEAQSILKLTLEPVPVPAMGPAPTLFHLAAESLLGSDIGGNEVPDCSILYGAPPIPVIARICVDLGCDFNQDGVPDVRDLVLMVRCIHGEGPCPPDAVPHFDCDGDGAFALGDVLCCGGQILQWPGCPDCPGRSSDGRVELTVPTSTQRGADVAVRLTQPGELGAARLGLRFPTDRYRLAGVDLVQGPEWLELHQASESGATVGLLRIQPTVRTDLTPLEAVLHLELLPGKTAGGEVRLEGSDFSANDGVKLALAQGETVRALGGALSLAVSPPRPNPFTGETRFAVTIDGDARLEVGIYDLAGRRVAQLFRGTKGPGSHTFGWDGRTDDGGEAREGIYFYRVVGAGRMATGKVALLRMR